MILTIYDDKKDKEVRVGVYQKDTKTFFKTVRPNHYMIKEKGYGIQFDALMELTCLDCQYIVIKTKTKKYKTSLANWKTKGNTKNYGHGMQVFLPIALMEEING